jgi:hypothetical protein
MLGLKRCWFRGKMLFGFITDLLGVSKSVGEEV